jgi:hypothetical protein
MHGGGDGGDGRTGESALGGGGGTRGRIGGLLNDELAAGPAVAADGPLVAGGFRHRLRRRQRGPVGDQRARELAGGGARPVGA